jgi:hypothetical protein
MSNLRQCVPMMLARGRLRCREEISSRLKNLTLIEGMRHRG